MKSNLKWSREGDSYTELLGRGRQAQVTNSQAPAAQFPHVCLKTIVVIFFIWGNFYIAFQSLLFAMLEIKY